MYFAWDFVGISRIHLHLSLSLSLSLSLNAGNTLLFYKVKTFIIYHYGGLLFGTSFF